ncbi:dienelactone hydrolase family protein [Plesiocystis pacifica]|uniref:dienelactone hydrolase family protein n=1 Tax=Plesiocystis pacifica TaxID=191768 RepID=UPI0012FBA2D1|nr:dienelactone hydrolase family protein [Plesiocystis pacifica]
MNLRRVLVLGSVVALCACNPRPKGDGAVACGELEPRNDDEVALCNELDQAVIARVAVPEGEPPASGWPTVVMLHGSGGLFRYGDPSCLEDVHDQFRIWPELLTSRGIAVVLPASFYSRGICDWFDERVIPRELTDNERLVVRTFDARAAAEFACDDPRMDCSRMAVVGFSNGASTAMMAMHEDLGVAKDSRLASVGTEAYFVGGVAYYPGCGLQGQLAGDLDSEDAERFFYPYAPMWVPHAENDSLLGKCEEIRDPQVDSVADARGVSEDRFELRVYAGADHGFDVWFTGDPQADLDAREAAQAETLDLLDQWLQ